jgi:hypothetical protein
LALSLARYPKDPVCPIRIQFESIPNSVRIAELIAVKSNNKDDDSIIPTPYNGGLAFAMDKPLATEQCIDGVS